MEFSDEERYALASLFTLALHATQFDGGNATEDAWGEPPAVERDPRLLGELGEAELEVWWGYDCVAPGGLLDRIFRELQVAPTKWKGLKLLPTAAPSAGDEIHRQMVRGLIEMLDPELAAALPPLLPRRTSSRAEAASPGSAERARRAVRDDLFEGLLDSDSDSDEDWRADLERARKLQASAERKRRPGGRAAERRVSQEAEEVLRLSKRLSGGVSLRSEGSTIPEEGEEAGDEAHSHPERQQQQEGPQTPQAVPQTPARGSATTAAALASPKAIGAMWELVQCCVGAMPLPAEALDPSLPPLPRPVGVRWYDARARVALMQVASWLQIPARKVANLELLLTQDKAPRHKGLGDVEEDAWARRMRYFKVGAAAVGGGALFAVTGGLAAPAIAAGMGSILGFIGAPTALAGTVTGFLASTAGAATVTTTMAASGAASTGSKMAYRVAEVSEFGFKELLPAARPEVPPLPPTAAGKEAQPCKEQGQQREQHGGLQPPQQQGPQRRPSSASLVADARGGVDPGHLGVGNGGGSGYLSARAQALRRAGSASSIASSGSSASLGGLTPAGSAPQQTAAPPAEQQQSAWQRWWGGGSKKEEEVLLAVPMRVKQTGDVKLAVTLYVSGWIGQKSDFESTWSPMIAPDGDSDSFTLVWESKVLLHLNSALGKLLTMQAAGQSLQLATHSFFYAGAGLVAALGPTVLLGTASGLLISNAWAVANERAVKAGKLLAHLLLSGAHGDRPVKLVAHGMGARLVFHCLLELCRQGARGVVQHAVLMGCPVGTEELRWQMARRAVAGRLVNVYTRKDWLLGVMAGGSTGWMKATAGLVPIECAGVENVNLTALVDGHFAYLEGDALATVCDMLAM